jgi:acetylornithine deacetylase/succinyl-diaminopimelate desuccinylase-like protein
MQKKHLNNLIELLSIPSVSAQAEHKEDMVKTCLWLKKKFDQLGFAAQIYPTKCHPVFFAQNLSAGTTKPTVLIYGHYDVQAPDPLDEWVSEPFKPDVRKGNLYARGVADDKGQFYAWIAAIEEILEEQKGLPINIKFLIEGEEEIGSPTLDPFIKKYKKMLKADVCIISDSHALSESQPLVTYGLRGLVYTEVTLQTLARDAHSGSYGGNVINPANCLAEIIGQLKDKNHKILIPGFYDDVRHLSKAERKELAKFPFRTKQVKDEVGAFVVTGEKGFSVAERNGARPTLDVNGIWGGYAGEGPKTIIPAKAGAKISMRIVPGQTDTEIFAKFSKYVKKITPKGVKLTIKNLSSGNPILVDMTSSYQKAAAQALKKIFGKNPMYELAGGSIPVTCTFKEILGIDSVMMGYGLPDDGLHSPNEKMSLTMLEKGIATSKEFLKNL